jgi:hypothetical protein
MMAKKIDSGSIKIDNAVVVKHKAAIEAMTDDEKTIVIAAQLEATSAAVTQKAFYAAKEAAFAQQKQAGILAIETARNDAKTQMQVLEQKWAAASVKGTWEIPQ